MIRLSFTVDVIFGDVIEVEFLFVQGRGGYSNLGFVFAHDFEKDRPITVEYFIYMFSSFFGNCS